MTTTKKTESIRWLLIGAGDIACRRVAPALVNAEDAKLTAVCDVNPAAAGKLAEQFQVKSVYTDVSESLSDPRTNAVYIATPQSTHIKLCKQTLEAGKPFLCEKPLGLNGNECLDLFKIARHSNCMTSCSNYRRLSEQYKLTEMMLKNGEIGRLLGGWAVYSSPFYNPGNHPIRKELGMSRIKELGFYLIDIVHHFFGMPSDVVAQASTMNQAVMNDVEDIATVILRFPGGQIFTIVFNSGSPGTRHELEIFGSSARIYWPEWPPHGNGPIYRMTNKGTEEFRTRTDENCHLPMIRDFVDALIQGRDPVCTLESAVRTEVITDAIFRSIDSGRAESVTWDISE